MNAPDQTPEKINCRTCGNEIGELVNVAGIILFHAGGGIWRVSRGYCIQCGTPYYYETNDTQVQAVIRLSNKTPEENKDGQ